MITWDIKIKVFINLNFTINHIMADNKESKNAIGALRYRQTICTTFYREVRSQLPFHYGKIRPLNHEEDKIENSKERDRGISKCCALC